MIDADDRPNAATTFTVKGPVRVVSDETRLRQQRSGRDPNLAERLQGLAAPSQVVIDVATRRQIGCLFECQDLGTVEL